MAELHDDPQMVLGRFLFSRVSPQKGSIQNRREIDSYCELHCESGCLNVFEDPAREKLITTLPRILKVTRHRYDREYLCVEFDTTAGRTDRPGYNVFLIIRDQSDADRWEEALCKQTGQVLPNRRRPHTVLEINRNRQNLRSGPSATGGFTTVEIAYRDGQQEAQEGHIRDILGSDVSLTPESSTSPQHSGEEPDYTPMTPPPTDDVLDRAKRELEKDPTRRHNDQSIQEEPLTLPRDLQSKDQPPPPDAYREEPDYTPMTPPPTDDVLDRAKRELEKDPTRRHNDQSIQEEPLTLPRDLLSSQPIPTIVIDDLCSTQEIDQVQCTHMEIECSQEKLRVTVNKEDLLNTTTELEIKDIFSLYQGSIYLKSCPEGVKDKLFIGTRVLQVNNQEPLSEDRAIDYITTSAGKTVNLLIQQFPLGVRVTLRVPTLEALGVELCGNQITKTPREGVMWKIFEGLKCVCPTLMSPDIQIREPWNRSITAIGPHHVPYDATTEKVATMLKDAISDGHLVLLLHPKEFCEAMSPDALKERLRKEGAVLNLTVRKKSLTRTSLKRNPPS